MDIKLESSTGKKMPAKEHLDFIKIAKTYNKELFVKLIVSDNIYENEIEFVKKILYPEMLVILQPVYNECEIDKLIEVQNKFLQTLKNIRIIPQMHKYLGLR